MKKIALSAACLLLGMSLIFGQTQQDTISKGKKVKKEKKEKVVKEVREDEVKTLISSQTSKGGYFSLGAGYTTLQDRYTYLMSLKMGGTYNHWMSMGLGEVCLLIPWIMMIFW
jgi:hypothetical protein